MKETLAQYDAVIQSCKSLFLKKARDYGTSWRILRLTSITDQLYIKASRIRTLEIKQTAKVDEGVTSEYIAIVNYCVIAMMQLELGQDAKSEIPLAELEERFDRHTGDTRALMLAKNHDYGEAWRLMRISSLTDLILMKIERVKQIEDNGGNTLASEGVLANYQDMLNYAAFALIRLQEQTPNP